jgi:hypothetical protein
MWYPYAQMVLVVCILAFHRDISIPALEVPKDALNYIEDPRVTQVYSRIYNKNKQKQQRGQYKVAEVAPQRVKRKYTKVSRVHAPCTMHHAPMHHTMPMHHQDL